MSVETKEVHMDGKDDPAIIRLRGIGKAFQTDEMETNALSQVSLDICAGEFVAITGPSGCGKSTLLSILGMLDDASSGQYFLGECDVSGLGRRDRSTVRNAEIGFIFQAFNLIGDLTVEENVALPLTYREDHERTAIRERVAEVLDLVSMGHRLRHFPAQLSGGQQQRVAVARALVGRPRILLADEPTGNLDSHNGEAVMQLLEQLHESGTTLCMVTHDLSFARRASRIIYMNDGRIVEEHEALIPSARLVNVLEDVD